MRGEPAADDNVGEAPAGGAAAPRANGQDEGAAGFPAADPAAGNGGFARVLQAGIRSPAGGYVSSPTAAG